MLITNTNANANANINTNTNANTNTKWSILDVVLLEDIDDSYI